MLVNAYYLCLNNYLYSLTSFTLKYYFIIFVIYFKFIYNFVFLELIMSIVTGGIFGQVRGKSGGIVFSAARTKNGKVNTAKQFVIPANPNTPDQQTQRTKFSDSVAIIRQLGPSVYQSYWNRAVGQLPGYQSLVSLFKTNMDANASLSALPDIMQGDLHFPATCTVAEGTPGSIIVTTSTEAGTNGASTDVKNVIAIPVLSLDRIPITNVLFSATSTRADATVTLTTTLTTSDFIIIVYFTTATGALVPNKSLARSLTLTP